MPHLAAGWRAPAWPAGEHRAQLVGIGGAAERLLEGDEPLARHSAARLWLNVCMPNFAWPICICE